jgi:hypothetical protein
MQYVILIYSNPERWAELSISERNQIHLACGEWHEALVKTGQSQGCSALQPVSTATTVREKNGKTVLTDGPFAETREVLGGFELIECKNLDEALAIARAFPGLEAGISVEVRPTMSNCME